MPTIVFYFNKFFSVNKTFNKAIIKSNFHDGIFLIMISHMYIHNIMCRLTYTTCKLNCLL